MFDSEAAARAFPLQRLQSSLLAISNYQVSCRNIDGRPSKRFCGQEASLNAWYSALGTLMIYPTNLILIIIVLKRLVSAF